MCSFRGFCIPGPWQCVALEHKEPLIFPNSTRKQQAGPDAGGFKLLNANEVSPAAAAQPAHLLRRDHHSPLPCVEAVWWGVEGTPSPCVTPCLVYHELFLHQNTRCYQGPLERHALPELPVVFSYLHTLSQEQRAS